MTSPLLSYFLHCPYAVAEKQRQNVTPHHKHAWHIFGSLPSLLRRLLVLRPQRALLQVNFPLLRQTHIASAAFLSSKAFTNQNAQDTATQHAIGGFATENNMKHFKIQQNSTSFHSLQLREGHLVFESRYQSFPGLLQERNRNWCRLWTLTPQNWRHLHSNHSNERE